MFKSFVFPIQHLEGNLVFTTKGEVVAYYEIPLINYAYLSDQEKQAVTQPWIKLFGRLKREIHILSVPHFFDLEAHQGRLKQEVPDGSMKRNALKYLDRMTTSLHHLQQKPIQSRIFLGVKLKRMRIRTRRKKLLKRLEFKWNDFRQYVQSEAELEKTDILEEELFTCQEQERKVYEDISCISAQPVTTTDLEFIIRHQAFRGVKKEITGNWKPRVEKNRDQASIQSNPKDVRNLLLGEYEISPQHIRVRHVRDGTLEDEWTQFLYLSYLPDHIHFPGDEWLYWLQYLPFPLDVSLRIRPIPNAQAIELIAKQKRRLNHYVSHTREEGKQQDLDLEQAYLETVEEEKNLRRSRAPLLDISIAFAVYGSTQEELYHRSHQLMNLYRNYNKDMEVIVPAGDQLQAFYEFLPGGDTLIPDFRHKLKPEMVAQSMVNGSQYLGDNRGIFVGLTGPAEFSNEMLNRPVFLHQSSAIQGGNQIDTKSPGILLIGQTGYGKSFAASLLMYQAIHHLGARTILIDSKGERSHWITDLPGLEGQVGLTRLGSDPKFKGMLDPFQLFPQVEAPLYAKDFLQQLVQVNRQHPWHHLIQEAIHQVKWSKNPSMSQVLSEIEKRDKYLYKTLSLYESFPFSQLVFGTGESILNPLDLDKPLNIIQIDELRIPERDKQPERYDEMEVLSKALMTPITGFVNQLVRKNRLYNQIYWEEAWIPLSSESGRRAIEEGIRLGRYWNSGILLVTQNATDVPRELVNNLGIKCVFKLSDEKEIERALEILEMEINQQNRQLIQNLREGECMMRDAFGRVGRLFFHCVFQELAQAFDTTPPEQIGDEQK
ncbi:AAA-like domain-containing protein [Seinonella peptonophila]|uniref:AAA-like domain-containing protein n=1 Tax=Seinonella peptonophila TaxID=112248 RepID=A0A1M5AXS5_9BACL|nr:ATP-binding protein [Seinonella peptonophila]SHF34946.1 AAA-like domain-containing protein [Seinonella peptonophila]